MAFELDFAHIPSGLGLPTIPTSSTTGISSITKSLVDKMTSDPGSLFANPMVNSVNLLGDSTTRLETILGNIAGGEPNASITQGEAAAYLSTDPIQDIRTSMGNFMMHTDRLSGLLKSQGINAPGLQQLLSIGGQMANMMTLLEAGSGCLAWIGGATGLFSQDAFGGFANRILRVVSLVERGVATIADIVDTLSVVANLIRGIADKDSQFLQNAVNQLQSAAVALGLEALNSNPCAKFLFEQVANRNPGGLLDVLSKPIVRQ